VSEILKDRAIVLRTFDFGETSVVVVALTRDHGKMRFLAKGARKGRSPFTGLLRTGNIGTVVFYHRRERGLQLLKEFTGEAVSPDDDFVKLCLFQAGLELADASVIDRESDAVTFEEIEAFRTLIFVAAAPWLVFFSLEVKLLKGLGVLPQFDTCAVCGGDLVSACTANPASGSICCPRCTGEGGVSVSGASLDRIRAMESAPIGEAAAGGELGAGERKEIGRLLHTLFLHHVEGYRLPNSLRLLKGVS
jgi:DNA repair protein RecO